MAERTVELVDVGPRDGLQNEPEPFDTDSKIEFIGKLVDAGVPRIEIASFVNPKRVPQMADAEEVIKAVPKDKGTRYIGLVLNAKGFERAVETEIDEINFVVVASDTFNQKNQGASVDDTMQVWDEVSRLAHDAGLFIGITIGASYGCPFEGEVPVGRVVDIARKAAESGACEIALADTIGVAVPSDIETRVAAVKAVTGDIPLRAHFHNTRNTGIANVYAAYGQGIRIFDASCGGIGGCPFAPAATGNVPSEDVLYMFDRMGVKTGIDLDKIIATSQWLEQKLNKKTPAMVSKAGLFPAGGKAA